MPDIRNSQTDGEPLPAKAEDSDDAYYRGAWKKYAGLYADREKKLVLLGKRAASQGRSFGYQGK